MRAAFPRGTCRPEPFTAADHAAVPLRVWDTFFTLADVATVSDGRAVRRVADQLQVVCESINHFVSALVEAVAIVLAVFFVLLGMRAGLVVTMTIPLVLAMTFVMLDCMAFTLQRVSPGALIIAFGLLVDDAMPLSGSGRPGEARAGYS